MSTLMSVFRQFPLETSHVPLFLAPDVLELPVAGREYLAFEVEDCVVVTFLQNIRLAVVTVDLDTGHVTIDEDSWKEANFYQLRRREAIYFQIGEKHFILYAC